MSPLAQPPRRRITITRAVITPWVAAHITPTNPVQVQVPVQVQAVAHIQTGILNTSQAAAPTTPPTQVTMVPAYDSIRLPANILLVLVVAGSMQPDPPTVMLLVLRMEIRCRGIPTLQLLRATTPIREEQRMVQRRSIMHFSLRLCTRQAIPFLLKLVTLPMQVQVQLQVHPQTTSRTLTLPLRRATSASPKALRRDFLPARTPMVARRVDLA